ncbi:MAG: zinc metalloprotease HtpX [Desulfurococcaceae archaeon]
MLLDFIILMLIYIVGFTFILISASYIAPRVAKRFTDRFKLQSSMIILGLVIIIAGLSGVALTAYILFDLLGAEVTTGFIIMVLIFVLILNMISYLFSPLTINIMYGAKPNPQLQAVVNEVSSKLGLRKPPKAVVVKSPPNAFAYGNFIFGKYVAVSDMLMEITTPEELKAIIGHEIGHHRHRDNFIILFMGLIPSVLYFLGVFLVRIGLISGFARSYYSRRREGGGGLILVLAGLVAIAVSFIVQILVLAFSRLREYYADTAGAFATSSRSMQRALARLHVYYNINKFARDSIQTSKLRTLFLYAFAEAYANPFYRHIPVSRDIRSIDIDSVVEELKRMKAEEPSEVFSTHPAIPKRIKFLDTIAFYYGGDYRQLTTIP